MEIKELLAFFTVLMLGITPLITVNVLLVLQTKENKSVNMRKLKFAK
jgi:hypothetical protein